LHTQTTVSLFAVLPRGNLAVLTVTAALGSLSSIALAFLPVYFTALGGSVTQYGLITAAGMAAGIPSTVIGGVIVPRFGLRHIAIATSWLAPVLLLGYYFSGNWVALSVVMILAGASTVGSIASRQLIADATTAKSRAGQLSLYQTLAGVPAMLSPAIGGYLVTTMGAIEGFRLAILVAVAASVASSIFLVRFLKVASRRLESAEAARLPEMQDLQSHESRQTNDFSHSRQKPLSHFQTFFKNSTSLPKVLAPLLAAYGLVVMANSITGPYFIFYATNVAKMDSFHWGLILSLQVILANIIRTPLGMVVDKIDKKKAILISILLTAPLASVFVFVNSFWAILAVSLAMVATGIYYTPTHESLQIELTPREKRPALFAIYDVISNISKFGGVLLGAVLFATSYALPFYMFSIIELAAAAVILIAFFGVRKFASQMHANP